LCVVHKLVAAIAMYVHSDVIKTTPASFDDVSIRSQLICCNHEEILRILTV